MWQLPAWKRPDWCGKLIDENAERWAKLPNHPCSFWTDEYEISNVTGSGAVSRRLLAHSTDAAQRTERSIATNTRSLSRTRTQLSSWTSDWFA